ncbi:MAG: hypothetical protein NC131_11505 [Roseburia sp.]|nr:hypothetical protein [Roseburia sp.]
MRGEKFGRDIKYVKQDLERIEKRLRELKSDYKLPKEIMGKNGIITQSEYAKRYGRKWATDDYRYYIYKGYKEAVKALRDESDKTTAQLKNLGFDVNDIIEFTESHLTSSGKEIPLSQAALLKRISQKTESLLNRTAPAALSYYKGDEKQRREYFQEGKTLKDYGGSYYDVLYGNLLTTFRNRGYYKVLDILYKLNPSEVKKIFDDVGNDFYDDAFFGSGNGDRSHANSMISEQTFIDEIMKAASNLGIKV